MTASVGIRTGPMLGALTQLHEHAVQRSDHFNELARKQNSTDRAQASLRKGAYYSEIAGFLALAMQVAEREP